MHWKYSEEDNKRKSESQMGEKNHFFGKQHSEESLKKMSDAKKGKPSILKGRRTKKIPWNKGIGNNPLRTQVRKLFECKRWRFLCFSRDNFICQHCGKINCYIEAHHIKPLHSILKEYNIKSIKDALKCDELWDITNGITLCKECHNKTKRGRTMSANLPEIGKKGKPLPTANNTDFMNQNLGLMDTVKIDNNVGTLTATKPKNNKALKDLIGPN